MRKEIRHMIQILVSAFLVLFQYVPVAGPWFGLMIFSLIVYLSGVMWAHPDFIGAQIDLLLFSERLLLGRLVAATGLMIFLVAGAQFLRKKGNIVTSGVYSVVRHPQYLGLLVSTLGLTIMCIQFTRGVDERVRFAWLIQTLGYVLLATFEEYYLLKDCREEYQQYGQKVPFIFPTPHLPRILEPLVSMILASIVAFLLTFLGCPYTYL